MSLTAREQRALESIADGLAESDPGLGSLLGIFSRLAADEEMPARNEIHPIRPPATGRSYRNRSPRRLGLRLGWNRAAVLLWLVITIGLIAVALALSNRGPRECAQSWGTACTGSPSIPSTPPENSKQPPANLARLPEPTAPPPAAATRPAEVLFRTSHSSGPRLVPRSSRWP